MGVMELVSADVLVWRAHFQSRAKERFQEHTLLYHAVFDFEAC
jgi:hypothetical protein